MNTILGVISSLALAQAAHATVLINDTFSRTGALDGSVTDTGQTWDTWVGSNPVVATNGSTLHMEGANSSRIGGLTLDLNCEYTLSMNVGLDNATAQWTGFGFGNQHVDSIGFMLFRYIPEVQMFTEDIYVGQQTIALANRDSRLFEITLQTGNTLSDSTLSWAIDGSSIGTSAAVDATGINSVFLQASGSVSTVDNFRLTHVPEPSSALLLSLGGIGLLARRKRS